ncbi:hypothetical protein RHMOL_Rhmol01G0065100 [Rhododendron molle]|uniref:Uncharacterized protein n=1 Tax=Rhododendron molle TaxID=49168 RepID=A0ACC0Q051_RHOML|nr:hypothetical protein RHMOL_Rhmol01G0065100 [Rhododendron molle]
MDANSRLWPQDIATASFGLRRTRIAEARVRRNARNQARILGMRFNNNETRKLITGLALAVPHQNLLAFSSSASHLHLSATQTALTCSSPASPTTSRPARFTTSSAAVPASTAQRFRLICSQSYDASLVNGWIADTLLRNVRELDLSFQTEHYIMLPQDLFTCRTLVVLKLETCCDMNNVPTSVSLPSLRILHLCGSRFVDDDSINRFLFGCPVLEELRMSVCGGENVRVINIVVPMLTSLFIDHCSFGKKRPRHGFGCKIVLDTPALLHLTIWNSIEHCCYLVENLHHLIRADIYVYADDASAVSKALTDLLKGISNVQFLQLRCSIEVYLLLFDLLA